MTAPLVRFEGFLKQIKRNSLSIGGQIALDKAYPFFWPADPNSEEFSRNRQALIDSGYDYILDDVNVPRRLSSCWSLPKSKYYSLCNDGSGNDYGTLANELNAYLDPLRGGLLMFFDMAAPAMTSHLQSQFGISAPSGPYLLFLFVGRPGAISPVIEEFQKNGLVPSPQDQHKERVVVAVDIPYSVVQYQLENTFDLRLPDSQEYIVEEFFKKDTECLRKENRSGIDRFVETLPILMNPALGGGRQVDPIDPNGSILQALASFLRRSGANALIYPSARSDVFVENKLHRLNQWRGWCLVDYRDAPDPIISCYIDMSPGWLRTFPKGASTRFATDAEYEGSFEVNGIVAWGRARVDELETEFLKNQQNS